MIATIDVEVSIATTVAPSMREQLYAPFCPKET